MNLLEAFGKTSQKAVDTFDFGSLVHANSIDHMSIWASKKSKWDNGYPGFKVTGTISFQKDGSTLEKEFKGDTMMDVFMMMYNFCQTL